MTEPRFQERCHSILNDLREEAHSSTPSLLTTVFGDAVAAHGGEIWLGSLIKMLAPLGASERLVRTSVYRLAQDGWLQGTPLGRRSYYRLTERAQRITAQYEQRIYYLPQRAWNGEWRLVFTGTQGIDAEQRALLRKRLRWSGFGSIAPNVFAHPTAALEPLWALFEETGVSEQVVVMRAENYDRAQGLDSLEMARQCFRLDRLESAYQGFIERFRPLSETLAEGELPGDADPEHCFALRTLLIHHYRRLLLKDPDLPPALLPADWAGHRAWHLCAAIYHNIQVPSEHYLMSQGENRHGAFHPTQEAYRGRFPATP